MKITNLKRELERDEFKLKQAGLLFVNKKKQKNFYAGAWGVASALPNLMPKIQKSFWVLFSKSTAFFLFLFQLEIIVI